MAVIVTDRLGVELGRARPDRRGQYELKITGPRYIIVKALLEGFPDALYQVDTGEIKESTTDREENIGSCPDGSGPRCSPRGASSPYVKLPAR